jgi:hypothetical protein
MIKVCPPGRKVEETRHIYHGGKTEERLGRLGGELLEKVTVRKKPSHNTGPGRIPRGSVRKFGYLRSKNHQMLRKTRKNGTDYYIQIVHEAIMEVATVTRNRKIQKFSEIENSHLDVTNTFSCTRKKIVEVEIKKALQ